MTSPVIGVTAGQLTVENAVAAILGTWMPTYIAAAMRRYGLDPATAGFPFTPKSILVVPGFVPNAQDELPYVQVTAGAWKRVAGDQAGWRINYDIAVIVVVAAQDLPNVRLARACYEDAAMGILGQHQSLGIGAEGVAVTNGGPSETEFLPEDARTLQASLIICTVTLGGVLDDKAAPADPTPLPDQGGVPPDYPNDPVALTTTLTYVPEVVDGPLS